MPNRANTTTTRGQIFSSSIFSSFFTFGRRDVADLADVDEEEREEQDVPPHVELQEGHKITM